TVAVGRIPEAHRLVLTGGGQALAIRTEGHAPERAFVAREREDLLAAVQFPDDDPAVFLRRGQPLAVRAEGDAPHPAGVARQGEAWPAAFRVISQIPDFHLAGVAGRGGPPSLPAPDAGGARC